MTTYFEPSAKQKSIILIVSIFAITLLNFNGILKIFDAPVYEFIAYTAEFLLVLLFLFYEKDHLHEFGIDKASLIFLIIFCFIRLPKEVAGEVWFLAFFKIIGVLVAIITVLRWKLIASTNWRTVLLGFLFGIVVGLFGYLMYAVSGELYIPPDGQKVYPFWNVLLNRTIHELSHASIVEEFLLRGFLWGYLEKMGLSEKRVFWFQSLANWLLHWSKIQNPIIFIIGIPVLTIVLSKLRLSSKQLFPGIVTHTIANALSTSILVIVSWMHFGM